MYLYSLLCFLLIFFSVSGVAAKYNSSLRSSVLAYGKLEQTADLPTTLLANWLKCLTVPKTWFMHFYAVGFVFSLFCIRELLLLRSNVYGSIPTMLRHFDTPQGSGHFTLEESLIGLTIMTIHLARRLYECLVVEKPSSVRIHMGHYLVGHAFYCCMVLGSWLEGATHFGIWKSTNWQFKVSPVFPMSAVPCIILFVYASYHQHRCHSILASLRTTKTGYQIPRGDWFEHIVVPHYFADILVYVSLFILYKGRCLVIGCGLFFSVLNLGITAKETDVWYRKTFDNYSTVFSKPRWLLLPGIY
ncbi:3-oxo-5-alpha-steroid 4-dehydrogenase-domain-containing protein [Spinellus fusiger]|nr:3-oxo-5-alpha-steroid 4-dehydrogenase-domain-containing protein [Spinellus fusiger]